MVKRVSFYQVGLRLWLVQRLTSLAIAFFGVFLIGFLYTHPTLDYGTWHELFSQRWLQALTTVVLLATARHAWIGVWTIITDYIKPTVARLLCQWILWLLLVGFIIWGIFIVWSVGS